MGNQSRVRHARREFVRAYPGVEQQIADRRMRYVRRDYAVRVVRNLLLAAAAGAFLWWRFAP